MVFIIEKTILFPKIQRGSNIFQGGGIQPFPRGGGGSNANFYRNLYNL